MTAPRNLGGRPRGPHGPARVVVVPIDVLNKLARAARKRRTSQVGLAREILRTVIADHLVEAVLDDAPDGRTRSARAAAARRSSPVKRGRG